MEMSQGIDCDSHVVYPSLKDGLMLFTLELDGPINARLQIDASWRILSEDKSLLDSDYTTENIVEIKTKSRKELSFEFEGQDVKVGSYSLEQNHILAGSINLFYTSRVFRKSFPNGPNYNQLIQAISCGEDTRNNTLILNVNGLFELRGDLKDGFTDNDPSIIVRHEAFLAGNGYVGLKALQGKKDWLEDLYGTSLKYWKDHLITHRTQEYSDYPIDFNLEDARRDLEEIEKNWLPEY